MDEHHRDFAMSSASNLMIKIPANTFKTATSRSISFLDGVDPSLRRSTYTWNARDEFLLGVEHGYENFCEFAG